MQYFKVGGKVCGKCMKKKMAAAKKADGGKVDDRPEVIKAFEAYRCGGKAKKKEVGGKVEAEKCGGKAKKHEFGGMLDIIEEFKCGGKSKVKKGSEGINVTVKNGKSVETETDDKTKRVIRRKTTYADDYPNYKEETYEYKDNSQKPSKVNVKKSSNFDEIEEAYRKNDEIYKAQIQKTQKKACGGKAKLTKRK